MKKMNSKSLTIFSLNLSTAIFEKRGLPEICVLSTSYTALMKFTMEKLRKAGF